jgi:hypothetical protein
MGNYIKNPGQRRFGIIDSNRWQELQKQGISPKGMYLLTELLVGRFRNAVGVAYIPLTHKTLAKITGMTPDEVAETFKELQEKDILEHDEENEVVFLKEYWRHNTIASTKHAQGVCKRIMDLPDNTLFTSMAKVFHACVQEARAYDEQHPPGQSPMTGEPYEPIAARYELIFNAVHERLQDNPIGYPIGYPIEYPIDKDIDTTETDTDTETKKKDFKSKAAFEKKKHESGGHVEPSIKKQNTQNLLALTGKYPEELLKTAWRFVNTTTRVLKPETWEREIGRLLLIDPDNPDDGEISPEVLDDMVTDFFDGTYSKANDRSIVLFNDPEVRKHLTVKAGIRSYYDYDHV